MKGTKEQVKAIAKKHGCTTHYSGKSRLMRIVGDKALDAINEISLAALAPTFQVWRG